MKEATESVASKSLVDTGLIIACKTRQKSFKHLMKLF